MIIDLVVSDDLVLSFLDLDQLAELIGLIGFSLADHFGVCFKHAQQFALACAARIAGENTTVLSAGTDGIDGNSPAAGAVVDGRTIERAGGGGLDALVAIEKFDAYPFFKALGDAIETGPTGNNLRDLRILLAY